MGLAIFRQGDVLLVSVDSLPDKVEALPCQERIVLAYGEVTGHAHAIVKDQAKLFIDRDVRYLKVSAGGAELLHEEHATIQIPEGIYRIVHQREYAPDSSHLVLD